MKIKVLGCSGGVGAGLRTTSFLIDDRILIDAGSGVGELALEDMRNIQYIFLTHSHLDHICNIPFLVDSIFDYIQKPIIIYALNETLEALKKHIFNNIIWPDFTKIHNSNGCVMAYQSIQAGKKVVIENNKIEMIAVQHTVPGVGYCIEGEQGTFAFSGDTSTNDSLWNALNQYADLDMLFVEAAFPDEELALSKIAQHYCPALLAEDLKKLQHNPVVYISHNKPGVELVIYEQCCRAIEGREVRRLFGGECFIL